MANKNIIAIITEYLEPIVEELKLEVVDIEFLKEGPNYYLRIYIDKDGGVDIIDCENVSRRIDLILDENDPIDVQYILEVSSPGIDRPLKKESDFEKYKGKIVDVKLYKALNKQKEFQGELIGLIDNKIIIKINEDELSFDKEDVAICRLAVIF